MDTLRVSYASFKSAAQAHGWAVYRHKDDVWTGNRDWFVVARLVDDTESTDFQSTFPNAVAVTSLDEAKLQVIGGASKLTELPRGSDGRVQTLPVTMGPGIWHSFNGVGDGSGIGDGQVLDLSAGTAGDHDLTWSYKDWIKVAGGKLLFKDALLGDRISFKISTPATVVTSTPGTGNVNKVAVGPGVNVIVPAPQDDGDWTLDDSVDSEDPRPVTAPAKDGWWEWSNPDEGLGQVIAQPTTKGHYNLFDFPIDMVRFVAKVGLLGTGVLDFDPPHVNPTKVLPQWDFTATLHHNGGGNTLEFSLHLIAARMKTL